MSTVTLYQNIKQQGYKIELTGDIEPENAHFNFASLRIGPLTEVKVFDRNNELCMFHNGSQDTCFLDDISTIITISENMILTLKVYSIKEDDSKYTKITQTNDVVPLETVPIVIQRKSSFGIIIIIIIIGLIFYVLSKFLRKPSYYESSRSHEQLNDVY